MRIILHSEVWQCVQRVWLAGARFGNVIAEAALQALRDLGLLSQPNLAYPAFNKLVERQCDQLSIRPYAEPVAVAEGGRWCNGLEGPVRRPFQPGKVSSSQCCVNFGILSHAC